MSAPNYFNKHIPLHKLHVGCSGVDVVSLRRQCHHPNNEWMFCIHLCARQNWNKHSLSLVPRYASGICQKRWATRLERSPQMDMTSLYVHDAIKWMCKTAKTSDGANNNSSYRVPGCRDRFYINILYWRAGRSIRHITVFRQNTNVPRNLSCFLWTNSTMCDPAFCNSRHRTRTAMAPKENL